MRRLTGSAKYYLIFEVLFAAVFLFISRFKIINRHDIRNSEIVDRKHLYHASGTEFYKVHIFDSKEEAAKYSLNKESEVPVGFELYRKEVVEIYEIDEDLDVSLVRVRLKGRDLYGYVPNIFLHDSIPVWSPI